jgi:predicted dehydrogenase
MALGAAPGAMSAKSRSVDGTVLRTGHIGTGRQGQKLLGLAHELPGYEVRAICDILPFRLDEAREIVGDGPKAVDDYRRVLDDPDIDVVFIATPLYFHARPLLDALDAGKHVYCEKVLVKGFDQIETVRPVLEDTDKIVQVGYQHRYSNLLRRIAEIIESDRIGAISRVECQFNRNGDWRRRVPSPEYERAINWRMYREYSSGLVAELSSHQMDIMQWLLNSKPRRITGFGGIDYWKDGRTTFDNTNLLVNYENNVDVTYTCLTTNAFGGFRMTFLGTKGTIVASLDEAWLTSESMSEENDLEADADGMTGATMTLGREYGREIKIGKFDPYRNAVIAFRESVLTNTEPAASTAKGLESARTVQLALDAMDSGTVQTF